MKMPSEDSKPTRKAKVEEVEAADGKGIGSLIRDTKKKPSNSSTKFQLNVKKEEVQDDGLESGLINRPGSRAKVSKTKKGEINDDDDDEDDKPIIKRSSVKIEKVQVKKRVEEGGNVCKTTKTKQEEVKEKKAKKSYDVAGQKRDPPEERDPLRIFYETLHKQLPHSEMAQIWMMESGLLSKEEAKKVFEKKQQKQKLNSPIKARSFTTKELKSVSVKKKIQSSPVSSDKRTKTTSKVAVKLTKKRKLVSESSDEDEDEDYENSTSKKANKRRAS